MGFLTITWPYLFILRPKNLALIGFTMTVLQYGVIHRITKGAPVLDDYGFILFVLTTLLIAASGNLVNDIFDRNTDKINKPEKTYIPHIISLKQAWIYYLVLVFIGFVLALYIGFSTGHLADIWIYPVAVSGLYFYAKQFKSSILIGNMIVSAFISLVWGILFYVEFSSQNVSVIQQTHHQIILYTLCIPYMLFAFLINMIREMVKDMLDIEGDKKTGVQTFPIIYGIKNTKNVISLTTLMLVSGIIFWLFTSKMTEGFENRFFYLIFIILPLILVLTKTNTAVIKKEFQFLSSVLKLIMVFALIGMILITKNGNLI
ncbi:MAG: geranylgeranylglycerol-phosphate geranylgeranyltransferase [Saprospiraceae bacterium]|nr:geranylgeranylglycerol-phosphate geranylgeranyltransferase [Saprospiraceae bacterium]